MTYSEWKDYAIVEYDVVSRNYSKKVYEAVVNDKTTGKGELVQLTLRDVMNKCAGTNFEEPIKRAIMKCVYTDARLDAEIRRVMDEYFEV